MNTNYINKFQRDGMATSSEQPSVKLTHDILHKIGFRGEGKDLTNKPAYRFEVPKNDKYGYYGYGEIQIVLGDYPDDNPNCGILSIYQKEIKDMHCFTDNYCNPDKKIDHVIGEEELEDTKYKFGIDYVTFPEHIYPIASYVNTLERLNQIYVALTGNPPFEYTPTMLHSDKNVDEM